MTTGDNYESQNFSAENYQLRKYNTTQSGGETFLTRASCAVLSVRSRRQEMKFLDVVLVFIIIVLFSIQFP